MSRRAEGLSFHTIVVAALALLVLVIVVISFTGRFNIISGALSSCKGNCEKACENNEQISLDGKCNVGEYCCIDVTSSPNDNTD